MKHSLLLKAEQCRLIAILLLMACGISTAHALESDDINAAILVEGSVPVKWTNDATHPWYLVESSEGSYLRTPETGTDFTFNSTLSFTYNSSYPVEITFDACRSYYNGTESLIIKVDGEESALINNSYWNNCKFMIPSGSHTVEFISDTANTSYYPDEYFWGGIRNLRVWECKELESSCLKEGSLPITFENDPNNMWITENGYIRSVIDDTEGEATTQISTTFTIDKISLFSFECKDNINYDYSCQTRVYIDGILYNAYSSSEWEYGSVALYPGNHTITFENWRRYQGQENITQIRNVYLDQTWYEATLNNPGELGVRLLQALGDKNLQDAELVKINGVMNADDWAIVKQLSGVKAIDFTGTNITEIPNEGMIGLSHLSTVVLPETLTKIGNYAFYGTDFHQVTIPASVEEIGYQAWCRTPIQFITFAPNSKLRKIGWNAWAQTKLIEFIMPNSVVEFGRYNEEAGCNWEENYFDNSDIFAGCKSLKKLHISDGLAIVPRGIAYQCSSLEEVHIPSKAICIEWDAFAYTNIKNIEIPETVTKIAYGAFRYSALESLHIPAAVSTYGQYFASYCQNLKEVYLSSHCWNMNYWFAGCTALEKVVLPCATPPATDCDVWGNYDPFSEIDKSKVKLYVPDFALDDYKKDSYWYNFTQTMVSDEASVNDFWAIRGNLTLNSGHKMQGTPSIEMEQGGSLLMDADATQGFNNFTFLTSESNPAAFLSRSNSIIANKLESRFYVNEANKWFFFSPLTDVNMADVTYPATESWVIRYYDGAKRASDNATSGNWINMPSDGVLKRGQGYIIQARETGWLNLPAASTAENSKFFGSNEVAFDLADNACETAENAGWNFVANPYPSFYDIYYIKMQAPITVWDGSTYRAYSLNDGDRGDDTFVLRPMQPFFVQKASADLTSVMPLVGRQINTDIDRTRAPRKEVIDENRHKLNLELMRADAEKADDYTRIVLNEQAKAAYETNCDASKFMSMDSKVAQLYSLGENGHPMAINERPYADGNVALGVYIPAANETYIIAARRADRKAWIYDAVTGIEQDLTESDYIFTADKTGVDNKRFSIRFAPGTNAAEEAESTSVKVTGLTGSISVSAPADSAVAVYAADGSLIANITVDNGAIEIPAAAGIYVVNVNGKSVKTIVK